MQQFCETSSFFRLDNVQNEAILGDFVNFWIWQLQKQSNSARLPSKIESWVQRWRPRTNAFCDFSTPLVQSIAPATKNWCQVIRSAVPVMRNHLSKPEDLMLQNATHLRKSAPWPPNSSDENVSCTAPATENASLQILFKCPTPAIVFGNATKPSRLAHFGKVHNPLRLPRETSSERPRVVRTWCVLYISTSKCASRHNSVQFFDIATSKSALKIRCFVHVDFEMCFALQRRALFRHLNFQKWSDPGVLEPQIIGDTRDFPTFRASASSFFWLFLFSDLLSAILLFSLTLSISAFNLSILSEVWLLNFLRTYIYIIWKLNQTLMNFKPGGLATQASDPESHVTQCGDDPQSMQG